MSDYGDDISEDESVASLLQAENEKEEKAKRLMIYSTKECDDNDISYKDKKELYDKFKDAIFQNVSTDKLYILTIKKS